MYGTGFAVKARAKTPKNIGCRAQNAPALVRVLGVVGAMLGVDVERHRWIDFRGFAIDRHRHADGL
jgi:hypothetical protein